MAQNELQIEAVGQVYAQALVNESIKQGNLAAVTEDVRGIGALLKVDAPFLQFCQAVIVSPEDHEKVIKASFGGRVEDITVQVLLSMARRSRLMFLGGMVEAFEHVLAKMEQRIEVELTSAQPLPADAVERVRSAVNKSTGKSADFTTAVDPSLIGGIKLRIEDTMIDGSVATQLTQMREQLKRRGVADLENRVKSVVS